MFSLLRSERRRAKKGAAFLTDELGPQWAEKIDLGNLDISWHDRCVLGQLFGSYPDGVEELNVSRTESRSYGFHANETGLQGANKEYANLTTEWKKLISARKEELARSA